jgi:porin-like protein
LGNPAHLARFVYSVRVLGSTHVDPLILRGTETVGKPGPERLTFEYVKIDLHLYGAGFYYIPGTDTCIKIGGSVRVQTDLQPR